MLDLYIYYQVKDADAAPLQVALAAMQAALAQRHAVTCQLKRRPEARDGLQTWMEVYTATPAGFEQVLDAAVAQARLADWIAGPRHTEIFTDVVMDVSPCA
jgi:hypothetical protein